MTPVTYNVVFNESNGRFNLDRPSSAPKWKPGLYAYQWDVITPTNKKSSLCGITQSIGARLSQYISQFNNQLKRNASELPRLVCDRKNSVSVQVFGPYPKEQDAKELEEFFISRLPSAQRLNKTKGGNGGEAWSQYDDLSPSKGTFADKETPVKYYPFIQRQTHIAPQVSPSLRGVSGVYIIKKRKNADSDEEELRYIGQSGDVVKRIRTHLSEASHEQKSKVSRAIAKNPEKFSYGVLPSTVTATPRTRLRAEKHHIDQDNPALNTNRGGGGPAKMKNSSQRFRQPLFG